jgi:hypothetical protein
LEKRIFIIPAKTIERRKQITQNFHIDILRFMTPAAGAPILINYQEISQQMITTSHWKPTWFEQQILTIQQEENKEEQLAGKQKKTATSNHKDTQNATKVLSEAAINDELKLKAD